MACEQTQQDVLDLNLGSDNWQKAMRAARHLEECERCREALEGFGRVSSVLRGGVDAAAEPEGGWDAFEARLTARAARPMPRRLPVWLRAAAALLVGLSIGWMAARHQGKGSSSEPVDATRRLSAGEVKEHTEAFGKIAEVFEGRTGWILISNTGSDLGMAERSGEAGQKLLLLRLTVTKGKEVVSQADLVMLPGQQADPVLPFVDGQKLHYRIGSPAAGSNDLAVWVQVQPDGENKGSIASLGTSMVPRNGQVLPAGQLVTPTGRYELNVAVSYSTL